MQAGVSIISDLSAENLLTDMYHCYFERIKIPLELLMTVHK